MIGVDGTGQRRLTHARGFDIGPVWSPDGTRIAYDRDSEIYVMNAGRHPPQAAHLLARERRQPDLVAGRAPDRVREQPRRQPGGAARATRCYVMDADGLHQRRLAFIQGEVGLPDWSPDGRRIAYVSNRSTATARST